MLRNLTISPELDKEDWDPDVITRMIIIAPGDTCYNWGIISLGSSGLGREDHP